jgi:hypothetical protein
MVNHKSSAKTEILGGDLTTFTVLLNFGLQYSNFINSLQLILSSFSITSNFRSRFFTSYEISNDSPYFSIISISAKKP